MVSVSRSMMSMVLMKTMGQVGLPYVTLDEVKGQVILMLMMVVKIKVPDCQGVDDVEDIDDYLPSIVYQEHSEQQRNWGKHRLWCG